MPWYEPKYVPNSNYLIHFKDLDKPQEIQTESKKQKTKDEPAKKKLKSNQTPSSVKAQTKKKTVKKVIKKKTPTKQKTKVTPDSLFWLQKRTRWKTHSHRHLKGRQSSWIPLYKVFSKTTPFTWRKAYIIRNISRLRFKMHLECSKVYIHTYVHTYIHTYLHIYIYICF